jgi:hypothetical protein
MRRAFAVMETYAAAALVERYRRSTDDWVLPAMFLSMFARNLACRGRPAHVAYVFKSRPSASYLTANMWTTTGCPVSGSWTMMSGDVFTPTTVAR